MYLGKISAGGSQLFPDIGYRIQPDDVDAPVGKAEHILRHVVEYHGVSVVQIPLIGIEGGHNDFSGIFQIGEITGCRGGEHLGNGLLVPVGFLPVVIEKVPAAGNRVSRSGGLGPGVFLAGVVHHEIQAHTDALLPAPVCQGFQIFHGSQLRLHPPEVRNGVAAIAAVLGGFQQGHQMEIIDAALCQIGQLFHHANQVSGKGIHIEHHAQKVIAPIPAGVFCSYLIQLPQRRISILKTAFQHLKEIGKDSIVFSVE